MWRCFEPPRSIQDVAAPGREQSRTASGASPQPCSEVEESNGAGFVWGHGQVHIPSFTDGMTGEQYILAAARTDTADEDNETRINQREPKFGCHAGQHR